MIRRNLPLRVFKILNILNLILISEIKLSFSCEEYGAPMYARLVVLNNQSEYLCQVTYKVAIIIYMYRYMYLDGSVYLSNPESAWVFTAVRISIQLLITWFSCTGFKQDCLQCKPKGISIALSVISRLIMHPLRHINGISKAQPMTQHWDIQAYLMTRHDQEKLNFDTSHRAWNDPLFRLHNNR